MAEFNFLSGRSTGVAGEVVWRARGFDAFLSSAYGKNVRLIEKLEAEVLGR